MTLYNTLIPGTQIPSQGEVIRDGCQVWPGLQVSALAGEQSADNIITLGQAGLGQTPTGSEGGLACVWLGMVTRCLMM